MKTTKGKSKCKVPLGISEINDQKERHNNASASPYEHTMLYEYLSSYLKKDQLQTLIRNVAILINRNVERTNNESGTTGKC